MLSWKSQNEIERHAVDCLQIVFVPHKSISIRVPKGNTPLKPLNGHSTNENLYELSVKTIYFTYSKTEKVRYDLDFRGL